MTEPVPSGQEEDKGKPSPTSRPSNPRSEQVMLRMPSELFGRVGAYMASLQVKNPGLTVSRADAIHNLVELGLELSMVDRRDDIRRLIASLNFLSYADSEMATEHGAPLYAGVDPADLGILNGYLKRPKELCPSNEAIQGLEPLGTENWYGQYRNQLRALMDFLGAELETPEIAGRL